MMELHIQSTGEIREEVDEFLPGSLMIPTGAIVRKGRIPPKKTATGAKNRWNAMQSIELQAAEEVVDNVAGKDPHRSGRSIPNANHTMINTPPCSELPSASKGKSPQDSLGVLSSSSSQDEKPNIPLRRTYRRSTYPRAPILCTVLDDSTSSPHSVPSLNTKQSPPQDGPSQTRCNVQTERIDQHSGLPPFTATSSTIRAPLTSVAPQRPLLSPCHLHTRDFPPLKVLCRSNSEDYMTELRPPRLDDTGNDNLGPRLFSRMDRRSPVTTGTCAEELPAEHPDHPSTRLPLSPPVQKAHDLKASATWPPPTSMDTPRDTQNAKLLIRKGTTRFRKLMPPPMETWKPYVPYSLQHVTSRTEYSSDVPTNPCGFSGSDDWMHMINASEKLPQTTAAEVKEILEDELEGLQIRRPLLKQDDGAVEVNASPR